MHIDKRIIPVLFPPLAAALILCSFFALHGIFPFGCKTAAWCDLNQQTIPLLMNLKDVLDGKSSIFYTAYTGGGMNFWGVFLFFLASPFYLAVKFIDKQDMSYFVSVLLIIKVSVCALTSSLYFSRTFSRLSKWYISLFGLIYAFCGYSLMYYQSLVWLDIMYLFPLLILSLDRLCQKGRCGLYILMLSAVMTVNYYLSYMIVIYLIIGAPLYISMRLRGKERLSASVRFVISSALSALITAPIWLCSFIQVGKSARNGGNLAKFILESPFQSINDKLCVVIADAFIFAVLLFAVKNPVMKNKRLRYNLIMLVFLFIPVLLDPINKFWHFGGYQSFPLRFGYIIVFTLLCAVCDIIPSLGETREFSVVYSVLSFIILAFFVFITVFIAFERKSELSVYASSLYITKDFFRLVFGVFLLAFAMYSMYIVLLRKKLISKSIFMVLISIAFLSETFLNMSVYIGCASSRDTLFETSMTLENTVSDDGLIRFKTEKKYTHANMLGALGMKSYSHYTSLTPEDYMFTMKKLGYSSYWMEVGSNGGTVLTDALLNIKYSFGKSSDFNSLQREFTIDSAFSAAENTLCLPAGIITKEISPALDADDRLGIQRQLALRYFGTDDMLRKYEPFSVSGGTLEYEEGKYVLTADDPENTSFYVTYDTFVGERCILYFDIFDRLSCAVSEPINRSAEVSVNGIIKADKYPSKNTNGLLCLGEFENERVRIKIKLLKDLSAASFGVFGINTAQLSEAVRKIKAEPPSVSGNVINVSCSAPDNDSYMRLAVPWDSGFKAYVNGKVTPLLKADGCFSAVKLVRGENNIKLAFLPSGFKISVVLSALGAVCTALFLSKGRKITESHRVGRLSYTLCRFAFYVSIILVYLVPVIIYSAGLILRYLY